MQDDLILAIHEELPKFNDYLLRGYTRQEVDRSDEFIATTFAEVVKQFGGAIVFDGYNILAPEERVAYELQSGGIRIATSELVLVAYRFIYDGKWYYSHQYMPYIKDDAITIKNTKYHVNRTIVERVFSRTNEGVSIRVIRSPIRFDRSKMFKYVSVVDGAVRTDFPITCNIHRRRRANKRNSISTTVLHYLLCQYGYVGMLNKFKLNAEDFKFVAYIGNDVDIYDYFLAKKTSKKPEIYLRVKRDLLDDPVVSKVIANLLYILTNFDRHLIEDLYEPTGIVFRIMLGRIVYGESIPEAQCKSHADLHMTSVDTYLDPITRKRLKESEIEVENIYDLLLYVFIEINAITLNLTHSNLYDKRIDIMQNILIGTIGKRIFRRIYEDNRTRKRLTDRDVASIFRFPPNMIDDIWRERNVTSDASAFGDNWLLSFGITKTRQSGMNSGQLTTEAPEHRFHPSMAVVETLVANSKNNPGTTGSINPFIEIDETGSILEPVDADEINAILEFLPYK